MNEKKSVDELISRSPCEISLRLQELLETPLRVSDDAESGYKESILCRTDWVEILLLRCVENPEVLRIEVEISVPEDTSPQKYMSQSDRLPSDMIAHMEYLLELLHVGFSLQVVGAEGLWLATSQFTGTPASDVVQRLVPPQVK